MSGISVFLHGPLRLREGQDCKELAREVGKPRTNAASRSLTIGRQNKGTAHNYIKIICKFSPPFIEPPKHIHLGKPHPLLCII
jgi:hypothetical protein